MNRSRCVVLRRAWAIAAVGLAGALVPAVAGATPLGGLVPQGCFSNAALTGCTTLAGQLDLPQAVAVSPDGRSAYATSYLGGGGTLVTFARGADGALTPQGCFSNAALAGCTTLAGQLSGAAGVTVSPDGTSVYATGYGGGTLVVFARAGDGSLTRQQCFSDAAVADCTVLAGQLAGAQGLAVSPDGGNLYATAATAGTTLSFGRAPGGTLAPQGCFSGGAIAGCTALSGQLGGASSVAVSPDGLGAYVAATGAGTVVSFTRGVGGALAAQGCTSNAALAGCTAVPGPLAAPAAVVVGPGGGQVYATSTTPANAVLTFARAGSGALTFQGCLSNAALAGCTTAPGRLDGAQGLAITPDATSVYVTSVFSALAVSLTRAADGSLTPSACLSNAEVAGCTALPGRLRFPSSVTVSPDGSGAYVTAGDSDALLSFTREQAPTCAATSSSGPAGREQTLLLDCRDPNGDPLTLAVVGGPAHGTLGAIAQAGRAVSYTPAAGYSGPDAVTFTATADGKTSVPATASITVTAPPAGPGTTPPTTSPGGTTTPAAKVTVRFDRKRLSVRRGRRLGVAFVAGAPGTARLTVLKGRATRLTASRRVLRKGRTSVTLAASATKRLKPGRYTLRLRLTPSAKGAKAVTATIPLTVTR